MNILNLFVAIGIFAFVACKNKDPERTVVTDPEAAIVLTVAGNTRTISADAREQDVIDFNDYPIKTVFRKKGQDDLQFEINLNLYDTNVRRKVPFTYTLPKDNLMDVVVDLNFFDFEWETENRMNKRLVFREGQITIHELSEDRIRFGFDGNAGEMLNFEEVFPVSGSVDVVY